MAAARNEEKHMAGASNALHESTDVLSAEAIDQHRALVSLQEELEAVDWYNQRAQAATDPELRKILAHNRDEEMEHAAMVLEWLRRSSAMMDGQLRTYLFTEAPILEVEAGGAASGAAAPTDGSLGIGSLRAES